MNTIRSQSLDKAKEFLERHRSSQILLLANAWDVSSAKVFEMQGFPAIGTTSAGIAASLGYSDGQRMSLEENLEVVSRIARRVAVPVSADIERGYADHPEGVADAARAALWAGAVGINIEDGTGNSADPLFDRALQGEKIRAIREVAESERIPLVINARIDVYLLDLGGRAARFSETEKRANAYREAGADCIFVPDTGGLDRETIRRLVQAIDAPLNVIAGAHTPPIAALQELGVARVSFGPRPMRALLALLRRMSREILETGTYGLMTQDALTYAEMNRWFERDYSTRDKLRPEKP